MVAKLQRAWLCTIAAPGTLHTGGAQKYPKLVGVRAGRMTKSREHHF